MADENTAGGNSRFELAVLGAALTNEEAWDLISRTLTESDFRSPIHARMYDEIVRSDEGDYWGNGELVAQALVDGGSPNGYELVGEAVSAAAPTGTLQHYLDDLRGRARAHKAAMLSAAFTQRAREAQGDPSVLASLLAQHEEDLSDLSEDVSGDPWESVGELMAKVEQGDTRLEPTVPTGFPDLDRVLQGGFRPGQVVTIAGRPAMGKSTIAMDFARYASLNRDVPGLHLSLEMSRDELAGRIAAAEGAIALGNIVKDELTDVDRSKVSALRERMEDSPLYILDVEDNAWSALRAAILSAHRRFDIKYVVIDTLQLVSYDESKVSSRQEEVGRISRAAKRLGKQLGIVVFNVVQLNRGPEHRTGNRPAMSDLRESGDLEQDSDVVALLHRDDYYRSDSELDGQAELIIAKHRNGPTGSVPFAFQGHYSRFVSLSHESDGAPYSYPEA